MGIGQMPKVSNFSNMVINSDFLILVVFWTAVSDSQPFAFFTIRRSFFLVFSRKREALMISKACVSVTSRVFGRVKNFSHFSLQTLF